MGHAKYVGRVGALAVALGIGTAVITTPGIAWADDTAGAASNDVGPSQNTPGNGGPGATEGQTPTAGATAGQDTDDQGASSTGTTTSPTTTTTTTTQGSTVTTVGGGSTSQVTFGATTVTGSIGTHEDSAESPAPSTAAEVMPEAAPTSTPSSADAGVVVSTAPEEAPIVSTAPTTPVEEAPPAPARASINDNGPVSANVSAVAAIPSTDAANGAPSVRTTGFPAAARTTATSRATNAATSDALPLNTFSVAEALAATIPAVPTVPPPTLVDTLLALPGTLISTALNLITQALAPLIGPGAPADNPVLWGVLAFVRRQFGQAAANSTPALAPRQTSQDLDDGQVHGTFGGTDADGDNLTYTVPATGTGAPAHGAVTIDQAAGTYTYTPTAGYVGVDEFYVTASDGAGGAHLHALGQTHSSIAAVAVTVTGEPPVHVNHPPVAANDSFTTPEDTPFSGGNVLTNDTDPDGDARTAVLVSGPNHAGSFGLDADGSFHYTPVADYHGTDAFTYTASDGTLASAHATATLTVTPVDDAPVVTVSTAPTGNANGAVLVTVTATDVDGDALTFGAPTTTSKGTVTVTAAGAFTYTPTPAAQHAASVVGATGSATSDSFTVTVGDGHGGTVAVPVSVAIGPKNAAPTANVSVGQPNATTGVVTGTVTGTDTDGDALSYAGSTTTSKGTVTVTAEGAFTYTPTAEAFAAATAPGAPDAATHDSFTVTVDDGHTAGATNVTVSVDLVTKAAAVNPAPIEGIALGNAVVGSTGLIYQMVANFTVESDVVTSTTFVRVYQPNGALIGDSAIITGVPMSAPTVRTDGGIAIATFDFQSHTATVTVVSGGQSQVTTTATDFQADGASVHGQYLLLGNQDAQNRIRAQIVPLSANAPHALRLQRVARLRARRQRRCLPDHWNHPTNTDGQAPDHRCCRHGSRRVRSGIAERGRRSHHRTRRHRVPADGGGQPDPGNGGHRGLGVQSRRRLYQEPNPRSDTGFRRHRRTRRNRLPAREHPAGPRRRCLQNRRSGRRRTHPQFYVLDGVLRSDGDRSVGRWNPVRARFGLRRRCQPGGRRPAERQHHRGCSGRLQLRRPARDRGGRQPLRELSRQR